MRGQVTPLSRRVFRALQEAGAELIGSEDDYALCRVYSSPDQRSRGAWSWHLTSAHTYNDRFAIEGQSIGSQWPATVIAKGCDLYNSPGGGTAAHPKGQYA
jgi:hypothetical protein